MSTKFSTGRVRSTYEFIKANRGAFSVQAMCHVLGVAPSGYYEWIAHPISKRAQEDARLLRLIRASFIASHGIYGAPRVFLDLREAGETCSKHRVARLMRENDLRALHGYRTRRWSVGKPSVLIPNLLKRQFTVTRRNRAWVTDITYIRTWQGWLYLAVIVDLFSRKIVGWSTHWNRTETRRDPRTGRKRRHAKAQSEWHLTENETLRIVSQDIWDRVVARWQEIDRAWPVPKSRRTGSGRQRSYVETHPPHLLAGMLRCAACGNAVGQVSGKGGGYYGCLTAARHACANRLLVRRRIAETKLVSAVRDRLADAEAIHSVLRALESEIRRLCADLPENLKLKRAALSAEERKIANFVEFIGEGKGTGALAQALADAERLAAALRDDIDSLESATATVLEPPPLEWVIRRLAKLQLLLERETGRSALLLRRVLGPVVLTPTQPEVGKSYYEAETALQVVDLLDDPEDGSNWLRKWTRTQPIRTAARIPLVFSLIETRQAFSYQAIAERAHHLRRLRMSDSAIGRELGVTDKTVAKAVRWFVTAHTETKHRQS